ncbi:MAG: histidine kinase N-terminal 7TM domain-containing protein [Methanoregula sp.]|jgi:PAS domain S-box-containing protein
MILQFSPFFFPLLVSAAVTFVLAGFALKNRSNPVAEPFALLMAATTLWSIGYAFQLVSADLASNLLLNDIEYLGIVTVPVAWLLLALRYTGRNQYITQRNVVLLFIIPALDVLFVATNSFHYLYYSEIVPTVLSGSVVWNFSRGPLFWLHTTYSYLLIATACILIASRYSGAPAIYRRQIALLLGAVTLPVLISFLYVAGAIPLPGLDLTPLTFTVVGILLAIGLFRYQLFTMQPVAYPKIFSSISDGIVISDARDLIIDLNPAARGIAGLPESGLIGSSLADSFPTLAPFISDTGAGENETHREIRIAAGGHMRYYDAICQTIPAPNESRPGHLFILRDITDLRTALAALETANAKITLLSTITRHDMANKLAGLMTYTDLMKAQDDPAKSRAYILKIEELTQMILEEVRFTRDYQETGINVPVWQEISRGIRIAKGQVDLRHVTVTDNCAGISIYADPLFVKVLINLMDNAVRHGGNTLTTIEFSCARNGESLLITCSDDGEGIPDTDKAKLFTRGFGKHTGLGLFLTREILAGTDISIIETGTPGKGARFELTVPSGAFRMKNGS